MYQPLVNEIKRLSSPKRAKASQWFFKTGPGQYGEGDVFVGLSVPLMRKLAKKYRELPLSQVQKLLSSKIHEHRFIALEILVIQYETGDLPVQSKIAAFYLKNTKWVNNWDLVDTSAPYILGDYLLDKPKTVLYNLARSHNLWEKRIAIIATAGFIKEGRFDDTLRLAEILLNDDHDLIHKAVGWMLREVGKKDMDTEIKFLDKHYKVMPRTALRYAIERFPEKLKKHYMQKR